MHKTVAKTRAPTALQQSGVSPRKFSSATLQLRDIETAAMVRLHSLDDPESLAVAICETGITLPPGTGQAEGECPASLCLSPGEWLIVTEDKSAGELMQNFQALLDSNHTAVYDTSDGLALFRLSGPGAPWLLSKLSCLDFLAGCSAGQHCARTRMAQISVLVHYHETADDGFCFDLMVDRSMAAYLWALLLESASHADELMNIFGRSQ